MTRCRCCGGSGREPDWRKWGQRIRAARRRKGWTLRELARRARCSAAYICDLEYGRRGGGLNGPATLRILRILGMGGGGT